MNPEFSELPQSQALSELNGRTFKFSGQLLVTGDGALLQLADGHTLAVTEPGFLDRLLDAVPVRVGGPHFYSDPVVLDGQIAVVSERATIVHVQRGELSRNDARYEF